jgi:ubiquinone/menaquinone biosynthesis C-methylase UbiE
MSQTPITHHHSAVNHWPQSACARAFWGQQEIPPYRRLLADTVAWLDPQPGEQWLDLGCGCGQLTQALWEKSGGRLQGIVGLDCAAVNERALDKLRAALQPPCRDDVVRFITADFSAGLPDCANEQFDGVVSGLAIQYAESYSEKDGCWTTEAYDRLLAEIYRVLRVGGRFVFSVNVPEPAWGRVALRALPGILRARRPARYVKNSLRMLRYGAWLTREARRGRFHYLPLPVIVEKLTATGFLAIAHRLTYAGQAYLIRCQKSARL